MDNIKTVFKGRGYDFDKVLKGAKNLSTFATVDNTPQRVMEKALGYKEVQRKIESDGGGTDRMLTAETPRSIIVTAKHLWCWDVSPRWHNRLLSLRNPLICRQSRSA
jgi:hypothetical protein